MYFFVIYIILDQGFHTMKKSIGLYRSFLNIMQAATEKQQTLENNQQKYYKIKQVQLHGQYEEIRQPQ